MFTVVLLPPVFCLFCFRNNSIGDITDQNVGRLEAQRAKNKAKGRELGLGFGEGAMSPSPPARGYAKYELGAFLASKNTGGRKIQYFCTKLISTKANLGADFIDTDSY